MIGEACNAGLQGSPNKLQIEGLEIKVGLGCSFVAECLPSMQKALPQKKDAEAKCSQTTQHICVHGNLYIL